MITMMKGNYLEMNRDMLGRIPITDQGNRTSRWQGIQHGRLANTIINSLETRGYTVMGETYAVSPKQATLVGGIQLVPPAHLSLPKGMALSLGFSHGNDSSRSLRIACGGTVLICTNGLVTGSYTLSRKHTSGLDLESYIDEGLSRFHEGALDIRASVEHLEGKGIEHDRGLLALGRLGILPWRLVGRVDVNWRRNRGGPGCSRTTAWDWYNEVNQMVKRIPAVDQLTSLEKAFKVAKNYCLN